MADPYKEPTGITAFILDNFLPCMIVLLAMLAILSAGFGYSLHLLISSSHA